MNNMFGIHTAMIGGRLLFVANVDEMVWNMMYAKLSANPIPNDIPIPFLRFLADSDNPIAVSMKDANDDAPRCQYSTSNNCMFANPRCFCLSMYWRSSGLVMVCCCPLVMMRSCGSMLMTESIRLP